jgi:anti-sigma regulatory factor (Ser/Thr protein kinase)
VDGKVQFLELSIKNRVDEIARVNQSFNAFAERNGVTSGTRRAMNLVFDDPLNNIVSYAYHDDNQHTIDVRVERSADRLTSGNFGVRPEFTSKGEDPSVAEGWTSDYINTRIRLICRY